MSSTPPRPRSSDLAHELRVVIMRLARRLRQVAPADLTPTQLSTLRTISHTQPATVGELAAIESVAAPSMSRVLDSLEAAGWIARERATDDRRVVEITLTADGEQGLETARRRRSAFLNQQLDALDAAERETLKDAVPLLWRIVEDGVEEGSE